MSRTIDNVWNTRPLEKFPLRIETRLIYSKMKGLDLNAFLDTYNRNTKTLVDLSKKCYVEGGFVGSIEEEQEMKDMFYELLDPLHSLFIHQETELVGWVFGSLHELIHIYNLHLWHTCKKNSKYTIQISHVTIFFH